MIGTWTLGLLRRRRGRLAATAAGIAAAVALLACLGSFLAAAQGSMTTRAVAGVTVDWQVEVQPDAQPSPALETVRSAPHVQAALPVGFAHSTGFIAQTSGSTQTTGPGMVLGIPPNYREQFPGAIRTLVGADSGALVAQQTAANLHVAPGDTVQIGRAGLAPVDVRVDGVVDLPQADSLFQKVGAAIGAQPVAPPDNVVILGQTQWHNVFDPLSAVRRDLVSIQIHTALDHTLPHDPGSAFTQVSGAARNLEARSVGSALVGDNLGAALGAARGDAAYAGVLFLFLGLPAAVLAGLLTATVVTAGAQRRRHDQALLRARGASPRQLIRLAAAEAIVVGIIGSAVGLAAAALVGLATFGSPSLGADTLTAMGWAAASAAAGLAIAVATILAPVWRDLRDTTVVAANIRRTRPPRWTRFGLDMVALAASGVLYWLAGRTGYQIVLAPEGVPTISVSYWAFVAPALLWIGATLLVWRLSDLLLGRGWRVVARALRPLAGSLSLIIAHSLSRQRAPLARATVLVALAVAFAASTATFNATYQAQAEVDAQLTNGADVTVTEPPGARLPAVSPATDEMNTIDPPSGIAPQRAPTRAGSASARSPRRRGPTARRWCPASPSRRRCRRCTPARRGRPSPRRQPRPPRRTPPASATSAVSTWAVAPSASTSVGGGARGFGVEVGAGDGGARPSGQRPRWRGRCRSARPGRPRPACRRRRPAPCGPPARLMPAARGSRRSRAPRRGSSASWPRGGTGRRPCTAR